MAAMRLPWKTIGWTLLIGIGLARLDLSAADPGPVASTCATNVSGHITVNLDGSILRLTAEGHSASSGSRTLRFQFGLPAKPPTKRWLEEDGLPICHSQWEQDGIRYTQSVLLTRLADGDLQPGGKTAPDNVLLVQLVGENTASEYTEAKAALSFHRGDQTVPLALNDNLIQEIGPSEKICLGAIEIPSGGVAETEGSQLRFRGHMPPGTSGAMTFKLTLGTLNGEKALERLHFMDFTEESRRVRQYWKNHAQKSIPPVAFSPMDQETSGKTD